MKAHICSIILTAAILGGGCHSQREASMPQTLSNVKVTTAFSPGTKLPASGKYAFVAFASESEQDPEIAVIDQRIQASLSGELKKKGYQPGEYGDIRFFVAYSLGLQQQLDVLIAKSETEGNEWIGALVIPNDYVSGALLVQIIDAQRMEPVWLGVFNADIAIASVSEQDKQERVSYAVRELLKSFPPR
jgi:hypothetical protein